MDKPIYALSIKQPWSWLICRGYKDIENRDWATAFRGRIYVHAGKNADSRTGFAEALAMLKVAWPNEWETAWSQFWRWYQGRVGGSIIGEVDIVRCLRRGNSSDEIPGHGPSIGDQQADMEIMRKEVPEYFSPWFTGPYGFVLANPILYEKPIPYRGQLRFFDVDLKNQPGKR